MRVLIVNTSERTGGAAVAANRLMEALNNNGVKAKMLVRDKETDHLTVAGLPLSWRHHWNFLWERFVIWLHLHLRREHLFEVRGNRQDQKHIYRYSSPDFPYTGRRLPQHLYYLPL